MKKQLTKKLTDKEYLEAAKKLYQNDGELEFDDGLGTRLVSRTPDEGAYIQCWRWIYDDDVRAVMRGPERPTGNRCEVKPGGRS